MRQPLVEPENDYSSLDHRGEIIPELAIAVVIPVYNRVDLLRRTVAGLIAQMYPSNLIQVVVADDGSNEDVSAGLEDLQGRLSLTVVRREHEGYGAGQARNLGAATAKDADVLIFFDADCVPDEEAVARHAAWHHLASNLVVVGSRHHLDTSELDAADLMADPDLLRRKAFGKSNPGWSELRSNDFRSTLHRRTASLRYGDEGFRSLVSSNFSVDTAAFQQTGGFSEDFTRWGGEDTELGWRLWNNGAFFVDEPHAAMFHQTQEDVGPEGWRDTQRTSNEGLIQSKIPHRFYRRQLPVVNEAPKVSVIVHMPRGPRLDQVTDQILAQRLADIEIIVCGVGAGLAEFLERRFADPRFGHADDPTEAVKQAAGEFIAFLHADAAPDHRLLSRSVSAIERRPRLGRVTSAYGIKGQDGEDVYTSDADLAYLDDVWADDLPVFGMVRRRDLMKVVQNGGDASAAWRWASDALESVSHNSPLVWLAGPKPVDAIDDLRPPSSLRSDVIKDLRQGGRKALAAPIRAARSLITGDAYLPSTKSSTTSVQPRDPAMPTIRYVGWTGKGNMGDEAMLDAVRNLFDWTDVRVDGDGGDILMLGGGTLINRGYLKHLRVYDSPRRERVTFGTGVANPEYWGEPKERREEWVAFAESCLYLGVRGPISADLLSDWGVRSEVEVVGDPALSLTPGDVNRVEGRVVVCPAWSRGLLWGGSDDDVIDAFARLVSHLRKADHDVWVLSAFPADDRHIIDMMRRADASDLPYLAAHDNPGAAVDLLATADLAVAERLHGAVLAAAAGTVPVMVEYRPKMKDFAASIDLTDLVIRTDALNGDALIDKTMSTLASRANIEEKMATRVAELRKSQLEAANRIRRLVEA